jgi:hypothetical protein
MGIDALHGAGVRLVVVEFALVYEVDAEAESPGDLIQEPGVG